MWFYGKYKYILIAFKYFFYIYSVIAYINYNLDYFNYIYIDKIYSELKLFYFKNNNDKNHFYSNNINKIYQLSRQIRTLSIQRYLLPIQVEGPTPHKVQSLECPPWVRGN